MRLRRVVFALSLVLCASQAFANGRAGPAGPNINAPTWKAGAPAFVARAAWHTGQRAYVASSQLVAVALGDLGSGKFTRLPGPWCADAVSAWLVRAGKPPLANRMAASALAYGSHVSNPSPGDLVVMATRRGYAGHVGIVEGVNPNGSIAIISGNWGHRVARGVISRGVVTAFVQT
ncbi:MAG: CHAP domain-containing protein [Beijerinckiaceae bacterium]|nr:CHAP domain-containing protein [Beijerinckiaceae bacterium]